MRIFRTFGVLLIVPALAACSEPLTSSTPCVPVSGKYDPATPGYIVVFHAGVPIQATVSELEKRYAFTSRHVYESLGGFSAELSEQAVSGIRCEASVRSVEFVTVLYLQ